MDQIRYNETDTQFIQNQACFCYQKKFTGKIFAIEKVKIVTCMKVFKTVLSQQSVLRNNSVSFDYVDSFKGDFQDSENVAGPTEVGKAFFSSSPVWVEQLFAARNKIVAFLGLKTSGSSLDREQQLADFKCEPGEKLGLFQVLEKTENEVILGEDDKHLDFRVSLFIEADGEVHGQKILTISTAVKFHNRMGKVYFLLIKPFHSIIVPVMLKGIVRKLEETL